MSSAEKTAKLWLVPTPIGNLEDITLRALRTLKEVDYILSEDTRTTGLLLKHYQIASPLKAYHIHNEHSIARKLADSIALGENVALVSDAGTPAISDPGFLLVRECIAQKVEVECLPGPTALIPALVMSGLPCERFSYEGFLPPKKGRQKRLQQLAEQGRTCVLYESPHRLIKLLKEIQQHWGASQPIAISREISKLFAQNHRGTVASLIEHFQQTPPRGEFAIVISAKSKLNPYDPNNDPADLS